MEAYVEVEEPTTYEKIKFIVNTVVHELKTKPQISVGILGMMVFKIIQVGNTQFGTVFVSDVFEKMGKTEEEAEDYLSEQALISPIVSIVVTVITAYFSDRMQLWKLLSIIGVISIAVYTLMLNDIYTNHYQRITIKYDIGFLGITGLLTGVKIIC